MTDRYEDTGDGLVEVFTTDEFANNDVVPVVIPEADDSEPIFEPGPGFDSSTCECPCHNAALTVHHVAACCDGMRDSL